jgi:D-beta-D-heptose 7-phosphate kinase/D-beta-D-heptose 1-phosphate adenosyltransferase
MNLSSTILFTLVYADIFQYPYTFDELVGWIPHNSWKKSAIRKQVAYLVKKKVISEKSPFITLYGHTKNIQVRLNREEYAIAKQKKVRRAAGILRLIPSILFVGVTGGLSIKNADEDDDIDLYICTKNGTLWITRFISTMLLEMFGMRRHPETRNVKDTICLNMFVTEDALAVPPDQRDLYTAHEVLQMNPLWERGGAYSLFLKKNSWVSEIFSEKWKEVIRKHKGKRSHYHHTVFALSVIMLLKILEKSAKYLQLWYMNKRRTSEVVSDTIIRFHPHDARLWIHKELQTKLRRYHLPLDKNFFHP